MPIGASRPGAHRLRRQPLVPADRQDHERPSPDRAGLRRLPHQRVRRRRGAAGRLRQLPRRGAEGRRTTRIPKSKFTDPRNADRVEILDARYCVTCHQEHRPGITQRDGRHAADRLLLPLPSRHRRGPAEPQGSGVRHLRLGGLPQLPRQPRALCRTSSIKHAGEPDQLDDATRRAGRLAQGKGRRASRWPSRSPAAATPTRRPRTPAMPRSSPTGRPTSTPTPASTARAATRPRTSRALDRSARNRDLQELPRQPGAHLHRRQARHAAARRHAGRATTGRFGLFTDAQLPPMTPAQARAADEGRRRSDTALGCNTCHAAHATTASRAKVEACTGCHDDTHTKAYFASPHYELLKRETAGELPRGSGVSCATCHLPVDRDARRRRREGDLRHPQPERQPAAERKDGAQRLRPLPRPAVHARRARRSGAGRQQLQGQAIRPHREHRVGAEDARRSEARHANDNASTRHHNPEARRSTDMARRIRKTRQRRRCRRRHGGGDRRLRAVVRQQGAQGRAAAAGRRHAARGDGGRPHRLHPAASSTGCRTRRRSSRPTSTSWTRRRCRCRRRCSASAPRRSAEKKKTFSYSLLSLWPINKQNAPRTAVEKNGLEAVADNKGKTFYGEETLGRQEVLHRRLRRRRGRAGLRQLPQRPPRKSAQGLQAQRRHGRRRHSHSDE